MNNQNNITELRGLKDKCIDIEYAKAISDTAQVIINSAKVEADYAKHNKKKTTSFMHDKIVDSSSDESNDIDDDATYNRRELADVNRMKSKLTSYVHRTGEGKQRIQCEYRVKQMIETKLTAMIEHESVPRKLNTLLDSGLFQDGVSKISGNNIHGHGKSLTEEWVFPYFMTAFSLSDEYASIFE